jgi:hypothetical protein
VAYIICVVCKVIHISKTLGSTNVKFERFNIMYRKHIVDLCARSFIHMPMKHTEYCKHATLFLCVEASFLYSQYILVLHTFNWHISNKIHIWSIQVRKPAIFSFFCGRFIPILGDLEYILVLHTFIWHISDNIRICFLQVIKNSSVALSYASYIQQICFILQDGMFYRCISNNVLQTLGSFPLAHGDVIPWGFSPWMTRRMLACFCCWSSSSNISHAIWMKFIDDLARICRQNAVPILLIASTYLK